MDATRDIRAARRSALGGGAEFSNALDVLATGIAGTVDPEGWRLRDVKEVRKGMGSERSGRVVNGGERVTPLLLLAMRDVEGRTGEVCVSWRFFRRLDGE